MVASGNEMGGDTKNCLAFCLCHRSPKEVPDLRSAIPAEESRALVSFLEELEFNRDFGGAGLSPSHSCVYWASRSQVVGADLG